jgi:hypothetical protein
MTIRSMPSNQNYRDNFDRIFDNKVKNPLYPEICGACHYRGKLREYAWCSTLAVRLDRVLWDTAECQFFHEKKP